MKYYKYKNNDNCTLCAKNEPSDENWIEITESEYKELNKKEEKVFDTELLAKRKRIAELKSNLRKTDYLAIKYAEGLISEEDYAEIKAQRQTWRDEINELEA